MGSNEEWKLVINCPGYEVSSFGNVRSLNRVKKISNGQERRYKPVYLSPAPTKSGHLKVGLSNDDGKKISYVHHLVAFAFLGPRPDGMLVLHNDGNSKNNRSSNLRYGTAKENADDCLKHGNRRCLDEHPMARLSIDDVSSVRERLRAGETQRSIASDFCVSRSTIQSIANGKSWNKRHTDGPHFYGK